VLVGIILLVIVPFEAIASWYVQFLPFVANAQSIYLFYSFFVMSSLLVVVAAPGIRWLPLRDEAPATSSSLRRCE
jgi:hypothetical protein